MLIPHRTLTHILFLTLSVTLTLTISLPLSLNLIKTPTPTLSNPATGESHDYCVKFPPVLTEEARATLVWMDPPAMLSSETNLVNDLDLEWYDRGMVRVHADQAGDRVNNVEQIRVPAGATGGEVTLRVRGFRVVQVRWLMESQRCRCRRLHAASKVYSNWHK